METATSASRVERLDSETSRTVGMAAFSDDAITSDDLGQQWVLKENEPPKNFAASVELSAYHTSNVALTAKNELDDSYLVGQVAASWQHAVSSTANFDLSLQQAFFRYSEFTELNFDSLNLGFGLTWQMPRLADITGYARYNHNRLTSENFGTELYTSHSILVGAQKVFQLTRADSFFVGVSAQWNFADPSDLERREYGIYGGYGIAITRSLSADAVYRASLYDYHRASRLDLNQSLAVTFRWKPVEYFTVNAALSGVLNRSEEAAFDYDLLNAGLSLSATYRF
jgi:hypothetical protein